MLRSAATLCAVVLTVPLQAQTLKLRCDIVWTVETSVGGREPIRSRFIDQSDFSVDLATKAVTNSFRQNDGQTGVTVRTALIGAPDQIVLCQGEKCQEPIADGTLQVRLGLTLIDLTTGILIRTRTEVSDNFINRLNMVRDMKARGECRPEDSAGSHGKSAPGPAAVSAVVAPAPQPSPREQAAADSADVQASNMKALEASRAQGRAIEAELAAARKRQADFDAAMAETTRRRAEIEAENARRQGAYQARLATHKACVAGDQAACARYQAGQ